MAIRSRDKLILLILALAIFFMIMIVGHAQIMIESQDTINATLKVKVDNIAERLDKIENYIVGITIGLIANLAANVISIKNQRDDRKRG